MYFLNSPTQHIIIFIKKLWKKLFHVLVGCTAFKTQSRAVWALSQHTKARSHGSRRQRSGSPCQLAPRSRPLQLPPGCTPSSWLTSAMATLPGSPPSLVWTATTSPNLSPPMPTQGSARSLAKCKVPLSFQQLPVLSRKVQCLQHRLPCKACPVSAPPGGLSGTFSGYTLPSLLPPPYRPFSGVWGPAPSHPHTCSPPRTHLSACSPGNSPAFVNVLLELSHPTGVFLLDLGSPLHGSHRTLLPVQISSLFF